MFLDQCISLIELFLEVASRDDAICGKRIVQANREVVGAPSCLVGLVEVVVCHACMRFRKRDVVRVQVVEEWLYDLVI